jgi:hypothetical protein
VFGPSLQLACRALGGLLLCLLAAKGSLHIAASEHGHQGLSGDGSQIEASSLGHPLGDWGCTQGRGGLNAARHIALDDPSAAARAPQRLPNRLSVRRPRDTRRGLMAGPRPRGRGNFSLALGEGLRRLCWRRDAGQRRERLLILQKIGQHCTDCNDVAGNRRVGGMYKMPASKVSTSWVALSLSTVKSRSPGTMRIAVRLEPAPKIPSSIVQPRRGIKIV